MSDKVGSRKFVVQSALVYSGTNVISQAALFASAFVLRRLLAPQAMGIWNLVAVIRGYLQPVGLGVLYGAYRELPMLRGRGDASAELRCRSVALWYSLAEAALLGGGVWCYAVWKGSIYGAMGFHALLVTGLLIILAKVTEAYQVFFLGAQRYVLISQALLVTGMVFALVLPLGALRWGVSGVLAAAIAAEAFRGGWLVHKAQEAGLRTGFILDVGVLKRLASVGIGLRLADYPMTAFQSLDLLCVTKLMGLTGLGLYAFAKGVYSQASDVTTRMGNVVYTRTLVQYGEGIDRDTIGRDLRRFVLFQLFVSIPLVCWMAAAIGPFVIRRFTPMYVESIPTLLILLPASFFQAQNSILFTVWIAEKRLWSYGLSNVVGVMAVGSALVVMWFVLGRTTLSDVALATVVGYMLYFGYMILTAGRELWGMKTAGAVLLGGIVAAGWMTVVVLFVARGTPGMTGWRADLVAATLRTLEGLAALSPLAAFGLWVTGSMPHVMRWFVRWMPAHAAKPAVAPNKADG